MEHTATSAACDRIEAALAWLDVALRAAKPDDELQRRHDLLREATASALLAIDSLIADDRVADEGGTAR